MPQSTTTTIKFDYEKSSFFRVIYVGGATGGPLPNGMIHMAVFNERRPIRKSEVYALNPNGTLGELRESESTTRRCDLFREIEASLIFGLDAAKAIRRWLDQVIELTEQAQVKAAQAQAASEATQ
ncbi:MAG: hypothetical protein AB1716_16560 [Planctomycetota bacterium]